LTAGRGLGRTDGRRRAQPQKHTVSNCKSVCLDTARGCLPRQGHRYMQGDALRAYITDVHYGTVTVSDSERSLSVLSAEMRLIVVVVYTWSATVMSGALQNIMRSVQQKLLNISKVDGQQSAMVLLRWPRGVADVDGRGSGGRHHTGGKQRVDRRRAQIRCRRRRRERGQHGAWLTAGAPGGQATIERRRTVGKTCKPTAQIEVSIKLLPPDVIF